MLFVGGSARTPRSLPAGVHLYVFRADGRLHLVDRHGTHRLPPAGEQPGRGEGAPLGSDAGPAATAGHGNGFLRFVDDGQLAHYLVGHAGTSPEAPTNATYKLGVIRPHSAFTPHAHAGEHFVLSLGYASCDVFDEARQRVTGVLLAPGMMIRIPEMVPHAFANRAGTPLLILAANTGYGIDHTDYAVTAADAEQREQRERRERRERQERQERCEGRAGIEGYEGIEGRIGKEGHEGLEQAARRVQCVAESGDRLHGPNGHPGTHEEPGFQAHAAGAAQPGTAGGVDYRHLAAALRALERAQQPGTLSRAERLAAMLRAAASRLEERR